MMIVDRLLQVGQFSALVLLSYWLRESVRKVDIVNVQLNQVKGITMTTQDQAKKIVQIVTEEISPLLENNFKAFNEGLEKIFTEVSAKNNPEAGTDLQSALDAVISLKEKIAGNFESAAIQIRKIDDLNEDATTQPTEPTPTEPTEPTTPAEPGIPSDPEQSAEPGTEPVPEQPAEPTPGEVVPVDTATEGSQTVPSELPNTDPSLPVDGTAPEQPAQPVDETGLIPGQAGTDSNGTPVDANGNPINQ